MRPCAAPVPAPRTSHGAKKSVGRPVGRAEARGEHSRVPAILPVQHPCHNGSHKSGTGRTSAMVCPIKVMLKRKVGDGSPPAASPGTTADPWEGETMDSARQRSRRRRMHASRRRTTGSPGCAPPRRCSNNAPEGVQPLLAQWAQGGNHDKSGRAAASELDSEEPPARPGPIGVPGSGCIAPPRRGESVSARGPQAPAGRRRRRRSSAAGGAAGPRGPSPRPRGRARGGARRLPGPDAAQRVRRRGAATGGGRRGDTNHTERPRGVSCTAAGRVSASGKGEEPPQGRRAAELVLTAGRTRLIGAVGGTGSNGREGGPHAGDGHSDGRA